LTNGSVCPHEAARSKVLDFIKPRLLVFRSTIKSQKLKAFALMCVTLRDLVFLEGQSTFFQHALQLSAKMRQPGSNQANSTTLYSFCFTVTLEKGLKAG